MKEAEYQKRLIKKLKSIFPGCIVMKNDANYVQGIPDLIILYKNHWGFLEVKQASDSSHRPNQDFYIQKASEWSYGAFVNPDNEKEILNDMERSFRS